MARGDRSGASPYRSHASVWMMPGATQLSRMPYLPHSTAMVRVMFSTPARAAAECAMPGIARRGLMTTDTTLP